MGLLMNVLSGIISVYMILIFIKIILTWFTGMNYGRGYEALSRLTDPYLQWFRRFRFLRFAALDLSPIAAIMVLSLANNIFTILGRYGRIGLGIILAMILSSLWSVLSLILGFCILVLVLRLIAYLTGRNVYGTFWRIIDILAQPVLYRINRIVFRNRIVNYFTSLISSIVILLVFMILCGQLAGRAVVFLGRLPF
ncbi:MAG: YggT family protein [Spirochaetaceae bacterium]|jgi:YggT family protein|nr:YggT family protein [Spirochaetaceae bacterium]